MHRDTATWTLPADPAPVVVEVVVVAGSATVVASGRAAAVLPVLVCDAPPGTFTPFVGAAPVRCRTRPGPRFEVRWSNGAALHVHAGWLHGPGPAQTVAAELGRVRFGFVTVAGAHPTGGCGCAGPGWALLTVDGPLPATRT